MADSPDQPVDPLADTYIQPPVSESDTTVRGYGSQKAEGAPESLPRVRYVGTYELLHEIARGGMGVVYKARQNTLKRIVAVKVILSGQLASESEIKRFLVEAEAAANLNHPGVVPVYEFGEHDGTHYFSMAYIDGPSLAEKVANKILEPEEAVLLLTQVVAAVAYAHSQGVIHRDLKPGNILLEGGVTPRIADFGLAKRIGDQAELTQSGTIMGSVYYMPPEQAAGRIDDIGPASDIYALGAILYKMLTGRPPFQAATAFETMQQVIAEEPVPPRYLNSSIPQDLETICLKCLEKDPARRYSTALELGEELDRFREGLPILARPISRLARTWRWYRRNPVPATLGISLVLVLLIGVASASTLWNRARVERRLAQEQQRMVHVLSELVLKKSLDETDEWLRLFFEPVEQQLLVARAWGEAGLLDKGHPEALNTMLGPIIAFYPQLSSLLVADGRGREHMLLSSEGRSPETGMMERSWRNRITRRDESAGHVRWIEWSDRDPLRRESTQELPDYDPRNRPWYQGAIARRTTVGSVDDSDGATLIQWTDPYVFFTTKDLGITASVTFAQDDGLDHVVAFDVLLEDITEFTMGKRPTEQGQVLVLTESGAMIGLPHTESLQSPDVWKKAFLKKPSDLGLDAVAQAASMFTFRRDTEASVRSFDVGARRWWAGVRPFRLGADHRLWILVLVPESDLRENLDG